MANQTRKTRPKGQQTATTVSARLYPAEHAVLGLLLEHRAAEMEAASIPGDRSFVGWLRATIRTQAKAAGISMEMHAPPPAPPKRSRR